MQQVTSPLTKRLSHWLLIICLRKTTESKTWWTLYQWNYIQKTITTDKSILVEPWSIHSKTAEAVKTVLPLCSCTTSRGKDYPKKQTANKWPLYIWILRKFTKIMFEFQKDIRHLFGEFVTIFQKTKSIVYIVQQDAQ